MRMMGDLKNLRIGRFAGVFSKGNGLFQNFCVSCRAACALRAAFQAGYVALLRSPSALNFEKIPLPITHTLIGGLH